MWDELKLGVDKVAVLNTDAYYMTAPRKTVCTLNEHQSTLNLEAANRREVARGDQKAYDHMSSLRWPSFDQHFFRCEFMNCRRQCAVDIHVKSNFCFISTASSLFLIIISF